MSFVSFALTALFFGLIGCWFGWLQAHHTVAMECEKLGGFYVGNVVYECVKSDHPLNENQELEDVDPH
ncbi:hypothetical protein ACRN91_15070 [Shewanella baltica]|uniref:hypothetical protein n=1 Tax=Shewanella baltica TaxID=62322 RepID=UPI003D795DCA